MSEKLYGLLFLVLFTAIFIATAFSLAIAVTALGTYTFFHYSYKLCRSKT